MMNKVRTLIWEEYRAGGSIAAVCFAVGAVLCVVLWHEVFRDAPVWHYVARQVITGTTFVPVALALLLALRIDNTGHMASGFSDRILRLPVPTWLTVAVTLTMRTAFVLVVAFALRWVSWGLFDHGPSGAQVILVAEFYLLAQFFDWLRKPVSGTSSVVVALLAIVIGLTLAGGPGFWRMAIPARVFTSVASVPGFVAAFAATYAGALAAVHATRRGAKRGVPEFWQWPQYLTFSLRGGAAVFRSPVAAQVWWEHRRVSRYLVPLTLALLGLWLLHPVLIDIVSRYVGSRIVREQISSTIGDLVPLVALLLACAGIGLRGALGKTHGQCTAPLLLPVSTTDLARARLRANGRVFAAVLIAVFLLSTLPFLFGRNMAAFDIIRAAWQAHEVSARELIWYFLAPVVFVGLVSWAALTVTTRTTGLLVIASVLTLLALFAHILGARNWPGSVEIGLLPIPVIVVGVSLGVWGVLWKRRYVSTATVATAAAAWLVLTLLVYPTPSSPVFRFDLFLGSLALAALGPLPYAALAFDIARLRHGSVNGQSAVTAPKRVWGRVLLLTGILLVLLWLKWPEEPAYLKAWRAEDAPTTLQELNAWYKPVPPDKNLATYYEKAIKVATKQSLVYQKDLSSTAATGTPDALDPVDYLNADLRGEQLKAWQWFCVKKYYTDVVLPTAPILDEAAASGLTEARWPINFADGFRLKLFDVRALLDLQRILGARALYDAMTEHPEEASVAILDMFPVADSLRQAPLPIYQAVRAAMTSNTANSLQDTLSRTVFSDKDLVKLDQAFRHALPEEEGTMFRQSLIAERTMNYDFRQRNFASLALYDKVDSTPPGLFAQLMIPWTFDDIVTARMFDELIAPQVPPSEQPTTGFRQHMEKDFQRYSFWRAPTAIMMAGNLFHLSDSEWRARVQIGLARAGIAAERYRMKYGDFPPTLDELVPEFLDAVPHEYFTTGPLSYRVEENGNAVVSGVQTRVEWDRNAKKLTFTLSPLAAREAARQIIPSPEGDAKM